MPTHLSFLNVFDKCLLLFGYCPIFLDKFLIKPNDFYHTLQTYIFDLRFF